jgi:hypothetical protein
MMGGFVFYIKDKKLTYGYNYVADKRFKDSVERRRRAGR